MSIAAVSPSLVFTGEGSTLYATAQSAPSVVLGHEAANLRNFAAIAAANGGYTTQQQDWVVLGFVNGRLTVIGGESKAVIVIPGDKGSAAAQAGTQAPEPPANSQTLTPQAATATLQVALGRVDAQLAAVQQSPDQNAVAISLLKQKDQQIRAAIAEVQSSGALGKSTDLRGVLVDVTI